MKVYYHTGLKELAKASGFRAETLKSLGKCSCFKRTHNFFLQVWEALYRALLQCYTNNSSADLTEELLTQTRILERSPTVLFRKITSLINNKKFPDGFLVYLKQKSLQDSTWKFWVQFVMEDCFSYISLYLGIRCKNWKLRMCALKVMAPLFAAYDRTCYSKLIPYHLADVRSYLPRQSKLGEVLRMGDSL